MANEPIRVAIIGTGKRSDYLYGPLLQALSETDLVAVWGHVSGRWRAPAAHPFRPSALRFLFLDR